MRHQHLTVIAIHLACYFRPASAGLAGIYKWCVSKKLDSRLRHSGMTKHVEHQWLDVL